MKRSSWSIPLAALAVAPLPAVTGAAARRAGAGIATKKEAPGEAARLAGPVETGASPPG